ncbi:MAG: ATP-binding cassette domain-containing protein [Thermodesulfobacteriota bacterium]|nr:ATP-binding cassette domain-containing protein [Thermodesulfobacteriota bacterium]
MEPVYSLKNIEHRLGENFCLKVQQLDIDKNKIHVVSGSNGAGKSTFLKILALLIKPQQGTFCFSGQPIATSPRKQLSLRRKITLVDQSPYLFPGDIFSNLVFGLKIRRIGRAEQQQRMTDTLAIVGLAGFSRRSIKELSGGEIQRVALARALVLNPEVLLLDEPTANIDHGSLSGFEQLLGNLGKNGTTVIMSTHDPAQAERLSGYLIKIQNGTVT